MVLVSNEWQNKCEDEKKTTANTATTAGNSTTTTTGANTTTTTTTATGATIVAGSLSIPASIVNAITGAAAAEAASVSETIAPVAINSIPISISSTAKTAATTITILANDNANNEQNKIKEDNTASEIVTHNNSTNNKQINLDNNTETKFEEVDIISSSVSNNKKLIEEDLADGESVLNYNSLEKIMAENTKESLLKEDEDIGDESNELITNNLEDENNKDLDESIAYTNSNTNTLLAPSSLKTTPQNNQQQNIITQQQHQQQQQQVPLSCPFTPQALSSALQSALNATNNANNSVQAAAGLQPNFLSQLALTANVAGLQKNNGKQSSFNIGGLDTNTIQSSNKSDNIQLETVTTAGLAPTTNTDNNGQSKIVLICEGNSHPFETRTICLTPNVECMVGRLIAKSKSAENNAIFDCKVLSRKHAVIWYSQDGKFWVKDTKSSNGTFINDNKLGDDEAELHFGDIVKFGVDVLENSRKEVHGCIIACVKLYLPDGREAISIDSSAANRSQYSGEGRISYDELHRLNLYIQETAQREKVLTTKLCSIQNILDATRKNSAMCWQSMITEDQLLHRIHSLEKKLQFMEKNVPENVLRNEVLKMIDDKNLYQHTTKEALRKVYQECCDAMQMLAKMESAYNQSDEECSLLRGQIMDSKQTLQDVNTRLLRLETEYNEYKDDAARQQQEAKEHEEQRIAELTEKLRERELECEDLKTKISELLIKRADLLDDEEQLLQKQAIEKLDAAIADMDLGEDDDDDDDDDEDSEDEEDDDVEDVEQFENKRNGNNECEPLGKDVEDAIATSITKKHTKSKSARPQLTSIFGENLNCLDDKEKSKEKSPKLSKLKKSKAFDATKQKSPPKRVRESTIMKWLQNSDMNKNEGSFDIFKAICNENDDEISSEEDVNKSKPEESTEAANEFSQKCNNFTSKLKNVQKNLKQLEAEIKDETATETETRENKLAKLKNKAKQENEDDDDSSDDDNEEGAAADDEYFIKRNGQSSSTSTSAKDDNKVLSKENIKYQLLKSSVNMLREAYNEIWDSVREQEQQQKQHQEVKEQSPSSSSPALNVNIKATTANAKTNLENLLTLPMDNNLNESDSEVESISLSSPVFSTHSTVVDNNKTDSKNHLLQQKLKEYQSQVCALNEKLQQTEMEAQHTLEIMQVECDDVKHKMENMNKVIANLKEDKNLLEQVISENKNNATKLEQEMEMYKELTKTPRDNEGDTNEQKQLEEELEEDHVLQAIDVSALEREEELITYKERLDEQQMENIDLRNEIASLKLKANNGSIKDNILKQYLPFGLVVVAIIVYFLTTYF